MRNGKRVRFTPISIRFWPATMAALMIGMGLLLSSCNTTAGVGQDVSATGHAVTRGAEDVKSGL